MEQNFDEKIEGMTGRRAWGGTDLDGDIYKTSTIGHRGDALILLASLGLHWVHNFAVPMTISLAQEIARQVKKLSQPTEY